MLPIRALMVSAACLAMAAAQTDVPANAYLVRLLVTDSQGRPLSGAEVQLDTTLIGVTDETGRFYLLRKPMPAGPQTLSVSLSGFPTVSRSVVLPADEQAAGLDLTIKLAPERTSSGIGSFGRLKVPEKSASKSPEPRMTPPPPEPVSKPPEPSNAPPLLGLSKPRNLNYEIVQIFYATDRQDTGSAKPAERYANQRSQPGVLARGTCDVSIPRDHRLGSLEGPTFLHLEYRSDPNKHVVLRSVDPLPPDPFYQKLTTKIQRSRNREAVVFIHGYNVAFEDAARRTAQLAYDVGFDGAPILYSWPSRNRVLSYTEDEDTVQWTAFHLRDFLKELAERSQASKIHVVAHSMGNRALAAALQVIAAERRQERDPLFRQIVLAAPDIGADTVELLAKEIRPVARRITLYASAYDDALMFSRLVHGVLRAGEKGGHLMVVAGIDTVDASAVRTDFLGHSYYGEGNSIVADIRQILTTEAPPEQRKLLPSLFESLRYWIVPAAKAASAASRLK